METLAVTANDLFGETARLLLERHPDAAAAADFSDVTVLVPNFHALPSLCQALAEEVDRTALIPPRVFTFPAWTDNAPLPPAQAKSLRLTLLYQSLKNWGRFEARQLWAMCGELLSLFDELTHYRVSLPDEAADFSRKLREAYASRDTRALDFESRLLHESWYALAQGSAEETDAASRHVRALAWLAANHKGPVYLLGVTQLSSAERDCLERIASRESVAFVLPEAKTTETGRLLQTAWALSPSLIERAQNLKAESKPQTGLRLFPASSLEQEALAASMQIRMWLTAGKKKIIVVAQDRLTTRRTRALLERAEVLVEDETGWPLSTTAAASAVMRWIEANNSNFGHEETLDLLKSPYALSSWSGEVLREGVAQLEMQLRKDGPAPGLEGLSMRAKKSGNMHAQHLVLTLKRASEPLTAKQLSLSGWCKRLEESLGLLEMDVGLKQDDAGRQLLEELALRAQELREDNTGYSFGEWRRWLAQEWESANFIDRSVESPVVFTHLAATRCRVADAVLILGADADKLPSPLSTSPFFNQRVRSTLGLPGIIESQAQTEKDLLFLLSPGPDTLITWRAQQNGEATPVSPWFARLESICMLAWGRTLVDNRLREISIQAAEPELEPTTPPRPALVPEQVPTHISPSGYNQLVTCPYQYFAARILRLEELEDIDTELDKRDYGETVHAILNRFHRQYPMLSTTSDGVLIDALRAISEEEFEKSGNGDFFALAWLRRWQRRVPSYLSWQRAHEADGWRWQAGEEKRSCELALAHGNKLELAGMLDRIDRKGDEIAVLDYKTGGAGSLREKLAVPGEDVQLPSYALLLDEPVSTAIYVPVDEAEIKDIAPPQDIMQLSQDTRERLVDIFNRLHEGAGLPAHGTEAACDYCSMRGLCRKDFWTDD